MRCPFSWAQKPGSSPCYLRIFPLYGDSFDFEQSVSFIKDSKARDPC